jgi:hypothetical protein
MAFPNSDGLTFPLRIPVVSWLFLFLNQSVIFLNILTELNLKVYLNKNILDIFLALFSYKPTKNFELFIILKDLIFLKGKMSFFIFSSKNII